MEYSAKKGLPFNSNGIIRPLLLLCNLSNWYNISLIFLLPMGEKLKGLQSSPFLAIHAKGGEKIKPKAKGPHLHFKTKIFEMKFSNDVFSISINWYLCFT
jgi:hypothetical protein